MELFLDSANPREITEAQSWGLLAGVTTNPGLIAGAGPDMVATLRNILAVWQGPVLVQAIGWHEVEPLVSQAQLLHALAPNIIVKLPMSIAGIQALLRLKQEMPDLRIAMTAVASISQAYLVGKAGADICAVFNGPLDQASDGMIEMVRPIRRIYDNYGFKTKILSCGRYPRLFGEVAEAGTDICTLRLEFMRLLYQHPFTDARMNGFLKDWQATFGAVTWEKQLATRHE